MSCLAEPEISLDVWAERMLAPLNKGRYPLSASIELTERCNLNCVHCYINQPANSQNAKAREMSTAQIKNVLDQLAQAGTLFLMMTGGEIFLRPDFEEIYLHAKRLGFILTLFTNGTTITTEVADMLAKVPPRLIEITLDGATAETFEAVTQVKGSFEQCLRGIRLLRDRGLKVTVKTVLMTLNLHELQAISDLAEEFGVKHRYDSIIWPRLDGSTTPYRYRLPAEESLAIDLADAERVTERYKSGQKMAGVPVRKGYAVSCGAGLRSCHIDCTGAMSTCMMMRNPSYDLLRMPFTEAWEKLADVRKIKRSRSNACEDCIANDLCSQCAGWSQLVHHDYETPDEYVCTLGKLRMHQFGLVISEPILEVSYE